MRTMRTITAILAAVLLTLPATASAQQPDEGVEMGQQGWEINAHAGYFNDAPGFGGGTLDARTVSGDLLLGARAGYTFGSGLFVQGEFGYSPDHLLVGRDITFQGLDVIRWGGALGWNLQATDRLQLFPVVGAGVMTWSPDITESETDFALNGGAGARYFLTPSLALRADARYHVVPSAMEDIQARISPTSAVEEETFGGLELSAGVSLFLGGPSDADGDGVRDSRDACPDTPRGVDVDARGCAIDSDEDGVADYRDECPDTPRGARVDADGCPTDSDGDGVYDGLDECPDTPAGAEVDEDGCPTDGDNDGVYDGLDECPDSPMGAEVGEDGCIERITLQEIHFDFDEASIRASSESVLREVGSALARLAPSRIQLRIEVRGHTDAVGPEAYNQQLGMRRARSVRDFLVREFEELSEGLFTLESFGESQPVASNDDPEGRQQNRRVEFRVLEGPDRLEGTTDDMESGQGGPGGG